MGKFRKRPLVIDALQWSGDEAMLPEINALAGRSVFCLGGVLRLETLEGTMDCRPGDWVIRGVAGEIYSCRDGIFKQTYEEVLPTDVSDSVSSSGWSADLMKKAKEITTRLIGLPLTERVTELKELSVKNRTLFLLVMGRMTELSDGANQ